MRSVFVSFLLCSLLLPVLAQRPAWRNPRPYNGQEFKMAKEEARLRARKALAEIIVGFNVQYRSVVSLQENRTVMEVEIGPTQLAQVTFSFTGFRDLGIIYCTASVPKIAVIEAVNLRNRQRTGQNLSPQQYQDMRFMFPDTIKGTGFGSCRKVGDFLFRVMLDQRDVADLNQGRCPQRLTSEFARNRINFQNGSFMAVERGERWVVPGNTIETSYIFVGQPDPVNPNFCALSVYRADPGRNYIDTISAYKTEACVRLVNYLKGPTVSAVSRLENFFLTEDTIEATLPRTLLRGALFSVSEPNKFNPMDISCSIMVTGPDWVFSVSTALEEKGLQLSKDEYMNLKTRFSRYPDKYITYGLPDDVLNDPNDINRPEPPIIPQGGVTEPPLGTNDAGEDDILWK